LACDSCNRVSDRRTKKNGGFFSVIDLCQTFPSFGFYFPTFVGVSGNRNGAGSFWPISRRGCALFFPLSVFFFCCFVMAIHSPGQPDIVRTAATSQGLYLNVAAMTPGGTFLQQPDSQHLPIFPLYGDVLSFLFFFAHLPGGSWTKTAFGSGRPALPIGSYFLRCFGDAYLRCFSTWPVGFSISPSAYHRFNLFAVDSVAWRFGLPSRAFLQVD